MPRQNRRRGCPLSLVTLAASLIAWSLPGQAYAQEPASDLPAAGQARTSRIVGKIEDYRGIYQTGTFTVFDGITRLARQQVFHIDDDGSFALEFQLWHPVLGCAHIDLEGVYHPLYLEPSQDYQVSIVGDELEFLGASGARSRQVAAYRSAVAQDLAQEREPMANLHAEAESWEAARTGYEGYAEARRQHLAEYAEAHPLDPELRTLLEQDIAYEAAHALICFRYQSSGGRIRPRAGLPRDFLETLERDYPIDAKSPLASRTYIDYLANLSQVIEEPAAPSLEARLAFYDSQGVFTPEELNLIAGAYRGDQSVLSSSEFASFDGPQSQQREFALRKRYQVQNLLVRARDYPRGAGRDMILSQGLARNYFAGEQLVVTAAEWSAIEELLESKEILAHLRRRDAQGAAETHNSLADADSQAVARSGSVREFLEGNRGKVIYIDFWSTWCAPCRAEMPHAERLTREFHDKDVVFLNLCVRSKAADWSRMVQQKELSGEQRLLEDSEFEELAARYGVVGFPTYVLIDREGRVVHRNAPRPSSGPEITELLNSLLN